MAEVIRIADGFHRVQQAHSAKIFGTTKPSVLLRKAAELIEEHGWGCSICRVAHVHGNEFDIVSAIMGATGWQSKWRGVSVSNHGGSIDTFRSARRDESEMTSYLALVVDRPRSRAGYFKTMGYVAEAVGLEDLVMWNDEYCHDAEEAVFALLSAADLAESRGD